MKPLTLVTLGTLLLAGCHAKTTRPYFPPVTGAPTTEIELDVKEATQALADVLKGDSLPVTKVTPRDGMIETAWFEAGSKRATHARRLGDKVVQVRAWIDPSRPGHSRIILETIFRPLADPSLSERELDRQVPPDHPVGKRMTEVLTELARLYSSEPEPEPAAK
ncbi:MAG TPA: hypothetical protein VLD58_08450 [Gemmatimonadales bacterium]|nr:hypothetical protein [Gemmatimonadales bacterium]